MKRIKYYTIHCTVEERDRGVMGIHLSPQTEFKKGHNTWSKGRVRIDI